MVLGWSLQIFSTVAIHIFLRILQYSVVFLAKTKSVTHSKWVKPVDKINRKAALRLMICYLTENPFDSNTDTLHNFPVFK